MARVKVNKLFRLGQVIFQPGTEHEMKKEAAEKLEHMGFVVQIKPKKAKDKGDEDAPPTDG